MLLSQHQKTNVLIVKTTNLGITNAFDIRQSAHQMFSCTKIEIQGNIRKLIRRFHASAAECDIDKQGRVTIPQELREYAGITKELVTIGSNKVIEVWSKERWEAELDPDSGELLDVDEVAEGLEIYGF